MEQPKFEIGEDFSLQTAVFLYGGFCFAVFTLFD